MKQAAGRSARLLATLLALGTSACLVPTWPAGGDMTSPFGLRWLSGPDLHRGIDLSMPEGTPIRAMEDGDVRFSGTMAGFGEVVWLDHGHDVLSVYAHLSQRSVAAGEPVRKGQVIGASGSTGSASAPHLHLEIWRDGRQTDPVRALGGFPPEPVGSGESG